MHAFMPDFIRRFVAFLGSDIRFFSPPVSYWSVWLFIVGLNLFIHVICWKLCVPGKDAYPWEYVIRRANAWGIITFPLSGFVLLPSLFIAAVAVPSWIIMRTIGRGSYRIACEVISTAAGERK